MLTVLYSPSGFADLVGVSKAAISQATNKRGLLDLVDGKIDSDSPKARAYLAEHTKQAVKAAIAEKTPPSTDTMSAPINATTDKPKTKKAADDLLGSLGKDINLDTRKKEAQIGLWRAQRDRHQLALAEKKKELIPRDLELRRWSAFDAALKTNIRDLPRRAAARLAAVAQAEGPTALERELEKEISQALARTLQEARNQGLAE